MPDLTRNSQFKKKSQRVSKLGYIQWSGSAWGKKQKKPTKTKTSTTKLVLGSEMKWENMKW